MVFLVVLGSIRLGLIKGGVFDSKKTQIRVRVRVACNFNL
jgi:hypothetical protein